MMKGLLKICVLAVALLLPLSAQAVGKGDDMISFTVKDMDGRSVKMDKIIGKNPVMLVFWASWCPSCQFEVPKVNEYFKKYGSQGMKFYGVNVDWNDSESKAIRFIGKAKMRYPVIYDTGSVITNQYGVTGVPYIIIADKHGKITFSGNYLPELTDEGFAELNQ